MRVLLIGFSTEKTLRHTIHRMREFGVDHDVLDLARLADAGLDIGIVESADGLVVSMGDKVFDFTCYQAVYSRAYWTDFESASRNAALSRLVRAIAAWLATCSGTIVNRPGSGASNCNKFVHGMELQQHGFRIPETVLTGDPLQASLLAQEGFEIVSKSCSSTKTRTVAMTHADWARIDTLLDCPTLFQRRIRGDEVRVHWIGGRLFPERIASHRVDYRFADPSLPPNRHLDCEVPAEIARLCDRFCESQSLMFAGFDFKIASDGSWIVLEANPMPGYESYDRRQKHCIARALADLLTSGALTPPPAGRARATFEAKPAPAARAYQADIYAAPAADRDPLPVFIGAERRPVCKPFFHPTRYDEAAARD